MSAETIPPGDGPAQQARLLRDLERRIAELERQVRRLLNP